ncbi:MAG: hypothetical protein HC809_07465 [Gammaproteobacteria bacterium]|nr:hypothetical protein [Gammaproteobacteria bacterium]
MSDTDIQNSDNTSTAKLVYILYLVGLVTGSLTTIVGLVIAYINRSESAPWLADHYTYQIRTFWIGLAYGLVSGLLMMVGIGFLLLAGLAIWLIVRCVKGFQWLQKNEAPPDVETWWI